MNATAPATLVVTATGREATRIADLADDHASLDRARRQVIRREPTSHRVRDRRVAVVIISSRGNICGVLNRKQALSAAWIEDAFVRALRPATGDATSALRLLIQLLELRVDELFD